MSLLFDRLSGTLAHAMDYRLQCHNMIFANMANIDTPNYTPVEIQFEEQLKSFLAGDKPVGLTTTHSSHFSLSDPIEKAEVEFDAYTLPDQKGNSVDIDHESSKLAENQILYRSLINAYSKRMNLLKHAITEGKQ
jgi:flagellar basal-body rod protein FlgB